MKKVGIIGGLGPKSTAEFYLNIISGCYKRSKTARPPLLIWSIPMEYSLEAKLLDRSEDEELYLPYLLDAAKRLEKGGAEFLVIPCNTVHIFINEIRKAVNTPVLSIVEETSKFLDKKSITKIGILATSSTINEKLYKTGFDLKSITQVVPDGPEQADLNGIIKNLVLGVDTQLDKKRIDEIIDVFVKKGVKDLVLACTDLQLIVKEHPNINIYDTMEILTQATVDRIFA